MTKGVFGYCHNKEGEIVIRFWMLMIFMMVGCSCRGEPPEDENHTLFAEIYSDADIGVHPDGFCGHGIGDDACNLVLKNQNDIIWALHEQQGDVILLDFSVMWCGPCQSAALTVEHIQKKYEAAGFQYVTVLIEDERGDTPDRDDVELWAEVFEIQSAPVLQGNRDIISEDLSLGWPLYSWPTMVIIDRDMIIQSGIHGFSEEWIENNIEDLL